MADAIKQFQFEETSVTGGQYRITVSYNGKAIDTFLRDTKEGAHQAFREAGYKTIAWAEGPKIICRTE